MHFGGGDSDPVLKGQLAIGQGHKDKGASVGERSQGKVDG